MRSKHQLGLALGLVLASMPLAAAESSEQLIEFQYEVEIPAVKAEDLPLQIMVPLAPSNEQQAVITRDIQSSAAHVLREARLQKESSHGNEVWSWTIDKPQPSPTTINFRYKVLRRVHEVGSWKSAMQAEYKPDEKAPYERYLQANARVPVEGELIRKLQKEIPNSANTPVKKAKAIYDYVVDNMEYKKVGTGWGHGDTYWACSKKYGNCTDFHALLTSMARAEGIPAKFSIGFPIPLDKTAGDIAGYHCWLELYLPQLGWVPMDASEAKKNLARRESYFGQHPADRILFSVGRDLVLPGMKGKPLNYFIYPYVEKKGQAIENFAKTQFRYRLLKLEDQKVSL